MKTRICVLLAVLSVVAVAAVVAVRYLTDDARRDYLGAGGWPTAGEAAYSVNGGPVRGSSDQRSVPIASLAKVMTAYIVLRHHPGTTGLALDVGADDVADTATRKSEDQSIVEVAAGERLTGRQALAALLLPSANNVAVMLARETSGTVSAFVAEMNDTAHSLGMMHTRYTDPSGFDPGTRSTATDQVLLARAAMRLPLLRAMVAHSSYEIPVAGTVHNTDTLLGTDGFAGIKTGSMDASGGCFMFLSHRAAGDVYGVVLGQHGHNLITAGLYAGKQLADRVSA
jgi:serine-type D-Ala-D-Ala carboxypeptidase (penicillin-binding protein 5/6)